MDGITLEGWFMPTKGKAKGVVICNHFSPGNRYGYAGHLKGWKNAGGFEVNFLPKYKALIQAGYHVLAYDLRNHGFSAAGQNGGYNPGLFEWKDVIGSLRYVRSRKDLKEINIHLHSICLGGNSTLVAMRKQPEEFKEIKSMILIQPLSGSALVKKISSKLLLGRKGEEAFEEAYREIAGFRVKDSSPIIDAEHVKIPTLVVQVKDDSMTYPTDIQAIYDAIPTKKKELLWIKGTKLRFKGYTYFSEKPRQMIEWYNKHN